jgi:hypothetical protein
VRPVSQFIDVLDLCDGTVTLVAEWIFGQARASWPVVLGPVVRSPMHLKVAMSVEQSSLDRRQSARGRRLLRARRSLCHEQEIAGIVRGAIDRVAQSCPLTSCVDIDVTAAAMRREAAQV